MNVRHERFNTNNTLSLQAVCISKYNAICSRHTIKERKFRYEIISGRNPAEVGSGKRKLSFYFIMQPYKDLHDYFMCVTLCIRLDACEESPFILDILLRKIRFLWRWCILLLKYGPRYLRIKWNTYINRIKSTGF